VAAEGRVKASKVKARRQGPRKNLPMRSFSTSREWARWLAKNHSKSNGIWLRFFKKASNIKSVTHDHALDEALCYGWIDGQTRKHDEKSWLQKFTPRRPKSVWSKRNREHFARLFRLKKMRPAGVNEVETAKADGRWDRAYDSPKTMVVPEDFLKELAALTSAHALFKTLNKANTYAIAWRLQTAKRPETREKRMKAILEMLERGETFH
jgi:uncharacterized protein YdeI (YjbR/CyaY-like superfamily)